MYNKKAIFVTFEGIEGSGKSYQCQKLNTNLRKKNIPVILTREPGGTKMAESLRNIILEIKSDINIDEEILLSGNTTTLISKVADKLLAGNISNTLRSRISVLLEQIPESNAEERAATAIYLIVSSPEFAR